ncbi:hypothetical protein [Crocosphaera sp.]|uniref:hypothetical protein n=1 Tax=Crocosphaera sp. TaxID=2729996 RepID=UPI00260FBFA6|nr:hypothetical protein [Crocosphaera sp.]MDJ0581958.1 hypothetical protein [Crocosphaera sp.]
MFKTPKFLLKKIISILFIIFVSFFVITQLHSQSTAQSGTNQTVQGVVINQNGVRVRTDIPSIIDGKYTLADRVKGENNKSCAIGKGTQFTTNEDDAVELINGEIWYEITVNPQDNQTSLSNCPKEEFTGWIAGNLSDSKNNQRFIELNPTSTDIPIPQQPKDDEKIDSEIKTDNKISEQKIEKAINEYKQKYTPKSINYLFIIIGIILGFIIVASQVKYEFINIYNSKIIGNLIMFVVLVFLLICVVHFSVDVSIEATIPTKSEIEGLIKTKGIVTDQDFKNKISELSPNSITPEFVLILLNHKNGSFIFGVVSSILILKLLFVKSQS